MCLPRGRDGALRPQTLEVAGPGVEESETESDSIRLVSNRYTGPKAKHDVTPLYTRVSGPATSDESRRVWTLLEL